VSRFLTAHQHNQAIQCHSLWAFWKIQDSRQIKNTDNTLNTTQKKQIR